MARVGCLAGISEEVSHDLFEAFRQRLRELKYLEGQTIVIDYRWAEGRGDRLESLAGELARLPVDVIFAASTPAARAAKNVTASIPIVMRITADPVAIGLAGSLARPGGNVTGIADFASPSGKHLEILRELIPGLRRVAVLHDPTNVGNASQLREVTEFARALGLDLHVVEARTAAEIDAAVGSIVKSGNRALTILSGPLFRVHTRRLVELAVRHRIVATYARREFAEAGGVISYGASLRDQYGRAANFVDKILKGARPGDLPIEQPTTFELVINRKAAKALGLTIPPSVLLRADQVID